MSNTFKNLSNKVNKFTNNLTRTAERYGEVHFISFLGSILSRLAYCNDNTFLKNYNSIMGSVIHPEIIKSIDNVDSAGLSDLLDDQKIFGLNNIDSIFKDYTYLYNNKKYLDVLKLNIPQNVNIITGEIGKITDVYYPVPGQPTQPETVKYISIGWTKYGEIYIVADKRMPKTIFLIFRGTYSPRTTRIYTNQKSKFALGVGKGAGKQEEKYLYGIFKATAEMIHTIIESTNYLATSFLGATDTNSVKIFTTGHSLGGAMCSIFAYLWMGIKKTAPYNQAPYNVLADNIVCVSLGSPRCMGPVVSDKFCDFVKENKILFLRITTKGDPVPSVPKSLHMYDSTQNYRHPCMKYNEKLYHEIWEDCNTQLVTRPGISMDGTNLFKMNYEGNLDCLNEQPRPYILNMASHPVYLNIKYTNAIPFGNFLKGLGVTVEVLKDPRDKSTVCRLIMGIDNDYKVVFFNVNQAREKPTTTDALEEKEEEEEEKEVLEHQNEEISELLGEGSKSDELQSAEQVKKGGFSFTMPSMSVSSGPTTSERLTRHGGPVSEDVRMNSEAFNKIIGKMAKITEPSVNQPDLCPLFGIIIDNPFNDKMMPVLTSDPVTKGGRRTRKYKKYKKSKKTQKRLSKKRRS